MLEPDRAEHDPAWLRARYDERNRTNISQHIRFAQFWYSANACFTDLREHCQRIAEEGGLRLTPHEAWAWLTRGGFASEILGVPTFGSFDVSTTRQLVNLFGERGPKSDYAANGYNIFRLSLRGATETTIGFLKGGRITRILAYERGGRTLPNAGYYALLIECLRRSSELEHLVKLLESGVSKGGPWPRTTLQLRFSQAMQALDTMIDEHWVTPSLDKRKGYLTVSNKGSRYIRSSEETRRVIEDKGVRGTIRFNV